MDSAHQIYKLEELKGKIAEYEQQMPLVKGYLEFQLDENDYKECENSVKEITELLNNWLMFMKQPVPHKYAYNAWLAYHDMLDSINPLLESFDEYRIMLNDIIYPD